MKVEVTEDELHTIAAALVHWSDSLVEMTADPELKKTDREMIEDVERQGHIAERAAMKFMTLSAALQADRSSDPVVRARHMAAMDNSLLAYLELTV
jgi:hypothetical protein